MGDDIRCGLICMTVIVVVFIILNAYITLCDSSRNNTNGVVKNTNSEVNNVDRTEINVKNNNMIAEMIKEINKKQSINLNSANRQS